MAAQPVYAGLRCATAAPGWAIVSPSALRNQGMSNRRSVVLVLSRKIGEKVVVPDCNITVTILGVEGGRVRLGITAPPETAVHREEVWHRVRQERLQRQSERLPSRS